MSEQEKGGAVPSLKDRVWAVGRAVSEISPLTWLSLTPTGFLLAKAIEHTQKKNAPESSADRRERERQEMAAASREPGPIGQVVGAALNKLDDLHTDALGALDRLDAWRASRSAKAATKEPAPPKPGRG